MTDTTPNHISLAKVVQRDPDIHSGDLVFTGTRVPVDNLVDYLKGAIPLRQFPYRLQAILADSRQAVGRQRPAPGGVTQVQ